ncbi:hypothetical protein SIN04_06020 [Methylocella tundrae]|nr:hypothetical protein SIN04_06020 [Methylocella tundrae]
MKRAPLKGLFPGRATFAAPYILRPDMKKPFASESISRRAQALISTTTIKGGDK